MVISAFILTYCEKSKKIELFGINQNLFSKIRSKAKKVYRNHQGYLEAEFDNGIKMVYIPAGEFMMGSPEYEKERSANWGPIHRVYLDGYWIGKTELS